MLEITQDTENAMMLSAYKGAEDGKGQIIRLYNTTGKSVDFSLKLGYEAEEVFLCDLNEMNPRALPMKQKSTVTLKASPKQIVTLKVI